MMRYINIDMDGVLADFDGKMKELTGKVFYEFGVSSDAWDALKKHKLTIYKNLNTLSNAFVLINNIHNLAFEYKYQIRILTGIPKRNIIPLAEEHKRQWMKKHFGHFKNLEKQFKLGPWSEDKWKHCYSKDDILIDDYHRNILDWTSKGGGKAYLYSNNDIDICIQWLKENMSYEKSII